MFKIFNEPIKSIYIEEYVNLFFKILKNKK